MDKSLIAKYIPICIILMLAHATLRALFLNVMCGESYLYCIYNICMYETY